MIFRRAAREGEGKPLDEESKVSEESQIQASTIVGEYYVIKKLFSPRNTKDSDIEALALLNINH